MTEQPNVSGNRYPTITISRLVLTCPVCQNDLPSPSGKEDWSLDELLAVENVEDHSACPMCPECGQFLTVVLPEAVEIQP